MYGNSERLLELPLKAPQLDSFTSQTTSNRSTAIKNGCHTDIMKPPSKKHGVSLEAKGQYRGHTRPLHEAFLLLFREVLLQSTRAVTDGSDTVCHVLNTKPLQIVVRMHQIWPFGAHSAVSALFVEFADWHGEQTWEQTW